MKVKEIFEAEKKFEVKKSMLKRNYYWKAAPGDNPKKRKIDKELFNRNEGYEVISMIQEVIDHLSNMKLNGFRYRNVNDFQEIVQKVEDAIATELPGLRKMKRQDVFNCLVDYFLRKG